VNSTCIQIESTFALASAIFRVAESNDVLHIHSILQRGFEGFTNRFIPSALKLTPANIESSLSNWRVLVCNDNVVGCAMAFQEEHYLTFCYMAITPEHRQIGLGSLFVSAIAAEAQERKLSLIKIVLREILIENIRFFTNRRFIKAECFQSTTHYVYELRL
jgi:N-acetylglutamate synthase-like GNAT family acetyltransferase